MITLPDRLITIAVLFVGIVWLRGACACSSATFDVAASNPTDPSDSIATTEEASHWDGPGPTTETPTSPETSTKPTDSSPFVETGDSSTDDDSKPDTGLHPGPGVACTTKPASVCAKFACDESTDCGGARCCLLPDGTGSTCECSNASMDGWQVLCQANYDCPTGKTCAPDPTWPGHGRCA